MPLGVSVRVGEAPTVGVRVRLALTVAVRVREATAVGVLVTAPRVDVLVGVLVAAASVAVGPALPKITSEHE